MKTTEQTRHLHRPGFWLFETSENKCFGYFSAISQHVEHVQHAQHAQQVCS